MSDNESVEATILRIFNSISLVAAIVTCIILAGLAYFKYSLVDRVSLRIQGIIALIDIARHYSRTSLKSSNETLCKSIAFSINFSDHMYLLLNVAIAFNIHRLLTRNKRPARKLQWFYVLASIVLAITINLFPLAAGKFGKDRNGYCRIIDDNNSRIMWNLFLIYPMNFTATFYCLFIFIFITSKINKNNHQLRLVRGSGNNFASNPMEFIWTLYYRISLYPLSCFITVFPFTLSRVFLDSTGEIPHSLTFIYLFCLRITGTLNFLTMVSDPHCQIAIKHLIRSIFCSEPLKELNLHHEIPLSRADVVLSTPYYDELEYPNGDRILVKEYIRLL